MDDTPQWHRRFAVALFNRSWELLDQPERSADDDAELLAAVFGSWYHWTQVGTELNLAVADNQIARACAAVGVADLALRFAARTRGVVEAMGWTDFKLASSYEVSARAAHAAGDIDGREAWLAKATEALGSIDDEEDRALIAAQIEEVTRLR